MNQQEFELQVFDHLETHSPADPLLGLDIVATVVVTINWTDDGTALTDAGVTYANAVWLGAGPGPITVFRDHGAGMLEPVERVTLTLANTTTKHRETEVANNRFRWAITPVVKLMRRRVPVNGGPPILELAYTASSAVKGQWKAIV